MSNYTKEENKDFSSAGGEVLLFTIDDVVYGIEIKYINEIIGIEQITVVPKGFGKEEIPYDERTCIIVLEFDGGNQAGIIVDRVREVTFAKPDEICATPTNKNVNANHYIKNIIENSEGIKLLLNCEKLVMEQ